MYRLIYNLNLFVISFIIILCSCSEDVIIEETVHSEASRSTDKICSTSSVEAHYYYRHERVSIQLDTTKEYIITRNSSTLSRSTIDDPYNEDLYNYTGHIISKTEDEVAQLTNDNIEIIGVEDVTLDGIPLSPYIYM